MLSFPKGGRAYLNIVGASLLLALLLSACAPGSRQRETLLLDWSPNIRPVTVEEAARALEFAELELVLVARSEDGDRRLSPRSGLILPAYSRAIPGMKFRASPSSLSDDADYRQIYYWGLQPLMFDRLTPGDIVFYSDGSETVTAAGLFAGWKEKDESFQILAVNESNGEAEYVDWNLAEGPPGHRLVAIGRLLVAAPRDF